MTWLVLIVVVVAGFALMDVRRLERDPDQILGATILRVCVGVVCAILGGLTVAEGSPVATALALAVAALFIAPAVGRILGGLPAPAPDEQATLEAGALARRSARATHGIADARIAARRWRLRLTAPLR